jgi:hypothetical protein
MSLGPFAEMSKPGRVQSPQRTMARASLKVGSGFGYQAAARDVVGWLAYSLCAHSVTREKRPSKAGAVRAMAGWDHWRWVSTPR